jgi:hypothetical protein
MENMTMNRTRTEIQERLLRSKNAGSTPELFPTLQDEGWDFQTPAPFTVAVVVDGNGQRFVGTPDDDGILWLAGCAYCVEGGDRQKARQDSLSYTLGCLEDQVTTANFRVVRGFGQTPVLLALL